MRLSTRFGVVIVTFLFLPSALAGGGACAAPRVDAVEHVQMDRVRDTWLSWVNRLRRRQGLEPYVLSDRLNQTAGNWSTYAAMRGYIDHKRAAGSAYYDYAGIQRWFTDKGIQFANVQKTTFTENIGWGVFRCKSADCTRALTNAIRSTFNMYLSERAKKGPHWNSLVNPHFREIGVGITTDAATGRYYLTVHYGTSVSTNCSETAGL